jgi:P pilus assembly chaperone PapD
MKMNFRFLPLSLLILGFATTASAQLSVDKMLFNIDYKSLPVVNVQVFNTDKENAMRVDIVSLKMTHPENDKDLGTKEGALIVSPKSFSLPAGGQRTVRLLLREKPKDLEEVYRVNFLPVAEDASKIKTQQVGINNGPTVGIKVLTGIGLLIFADPPQKNPAISWSYKNGNMVLKNSGNVNYFVNQIEVCSGNGNCKPRSEENSLYPSEELKFPWDGKSEVRLTRTMLEEKAKLKIKSQNGEKSWEK